MKSDAVPPLQQMLMRLRQTPWKFGFFSMLRRFSASYAQEPPVGLASRPRQEPFRLGQMAALTFAPREVAEVVLPEEEGTRMRGEAMPRSGNNPGLPVLRVFGLGMLGPNGPLPLHYTEMVRDRSENHNDTTLAHFFAVPVQLQEFVLHWIRIDADDQSHLGRAHASSVMGAGAIAGEVVADRQNKFRLVLGPLGLEQYLRFTPLGRDLPQLVEWVRGFVGFEFVWEVELRVRNDSTPPARLEDTEKLGWSTWLGGAEGFGAARAASPAREAAPDLGFTVGMVFEPEQYVGSRYRDPVSAAG